MLSLVPKRLRERERETYFAIKVRSLSNQVGESNKFRNLSPLRLPMKKSLIGFWLLKLLKKI